MIRFEQQVVTGLDQTAAAYYAGTHSIEHFLARTAREAPHHLAVDDGQEALTYRELDERVDETVSSLRTAGACQGSVVAVCISRSIRAAIAIHAAVRLGAVVAPLDPTDPPERLRSMLRNAAVTHIVLDQPTLSSLSRRLDIGKVTATEEPNMVVSRLATPDERNSVPWAANGGYLLFTSGSTGTPKGVLCSFAAVAHFAAWAAQAVGLTSADRVCAQAALTFDLSTFDLFSTTFAGAASILLPEWCKPFPRDTAEWMVTHRISVVYAVPTFLRAIVDTPATLPDLRKVLYAGEPYPQAALAALVGRLRSARVFNLYGPTETNVCTLYDVSDQWVVGTPVLIGSAIGGAHVEIVDEELVACRGEGELVVAGPTLLDGYVVDGVLTDPTVSIVFSDGVARRAYRTGDRAVACPNGHFLLRGRLDAQVKRRGHRIDLAGIERIVGGVAAVRTAAAIMTDDSEVVLHVEADRSSTVETAVAKAIADALPATHHPDRTVWINQIPRNSRGKVDYPRLRTHLVPVDNKREDSRDPR